MGPLEPAVFRLNARLLLCLLVIVPAALSVVLVRRLAALLFGRAGPALGAALILILATPTATFSTVLYAHVPSGYLMLVALALAARGRATARSAALSGLAVGLATLVAYQSAMAVPVVAAIWWFRTKSWPLVRAFVLGGMPMALVYGAYHWVVFGRPLTTAYAFQNPLFDQPPQQVAALVGGVWVQGYELLFAPFRGLFFYTPVMAPVFAAALWCAVRDRGPRRLLACGAVALALGTLAVVAQHPIWWGGHATGPRHLVPAMIVLAPFAAPALLWWPRCTGALAIVSAAHTLSALMVTTTVHEAVRNPLFDAIYPSVLAGAFGRQNLGLALGLGPLSVWVLYLGVVGCLLWALRRALLNAPGAGSR